MQFFWKNPLKALPVLLVLAAYAGAVFGAAGNVQFVIGDVKLVTKARETRALQKGAEINEGDRIITGAGSSAQIKMVDGGFIAVRPNTDMGFDTYRYNGKEDGSESAVVSLLQGGFRTITGVIGRTNKHNYHIKTETATIGIRGTDHEPMVILAPAPGQIAIAAPGTYDKVNVGVAFIQTDAGSVDIQQNQVGFAPVTKAAPVILPRIPPFYKPTPAPGPQQAKEESKEGGQKETAAAAPGEKAAEAPAAIRDTAVVDPTSTVPAAPAVAAVASAPTVLAPVVAMTAAGATGDVLNTTTQTVTTSSGTQIAVTDTTVTTSGPGPALTVAYPGYYTPDATTLANINTQIQTTQTALTGAQTQLTAGNTTATAAQTALSSAQTAATAGKAAYDTAIAAGVPSTNTLMVQALNAVTAAKQALQYGLDAYDGSGTGTVGSTGASKTLVFADQALKAGNRLVASAQSQLSANTVNNLLSTTQDVDFSRESLIYLQNQVLTAGSVAASSATLAASNALNAAMSAQSAAQGAALALSSVSLTDPYYAGLKAASDAATAAANAAKSAADAAVAAANTAMTLNQGVQNLLSGAISSAYSYAQSAPYPQYLTLSGNHLTFTTDASGQVTGATSSDKYAGSNSHAVTYSATGGTLMDSGKDAATGLAWGRWQGGQLTNTNSYFGQDASGQWGMGAYDSTKNAFVIGNSYTNTINLGTASAHWITGKEPYPDYLARVLTGTAAYIFVGGTKPTDIMGNVGTLNNATLAANFTAQTVDAGVDFSIGGNNWNLQSKGASFNGRTYFYAYSCAGCTTTGGNDVMTTFNKNGSPVQAVTYNPISGTTTTSASYTPNANLSGQLLGTGLNSAALQYSVTDYVLSTKTDSITGQSITTSAPNMIQGVAGFSGPPQNTATPYRVVGLEDGYGSSIGTGNYSNYSNAYALDLSGYGIPGYTGSIYSTEAPVSRVVDSASGLTEFIGTANAYVPAGSTTTSTTTPMLSYTHAATIKIGTAVNKDVGSTTIDGNAISWGRWEGGDVDIYSLDSATKLGTVANTNKSIHWITSGILTGPINGSLPISGTANYTMVGNTSPTDFQGNVGTLGSATLNADFSKMLVNTSVTANFNAASNTGTWSTTAGNVPIGNSGRFASNTLSNGVNGITHTATCTGASCGSQTYGAISGSFIGTAAAGAVLSYRVATGATTTTSITPATGTPTVTPIPTTTTNFQPTNGVVGLAVFKK